MNIKQKFSRTKVEAPQPTSDNASQSTGEDTLTVPNIAEGNGQHIAPTAEQKEMRVATEAGRRLLGEHKGSGKLQPEQKLRDELEPYKGHLVLISNIGSLLNLYPDWADRVARGIKKGLADRQVAVNVSTYVSDNRQSRPSGSMGAYEFSLSGKALVAAMEKQGFKTSPDITSPRHKDGLGLEQILESARSTAEKTKAEGGDDYLHIAIVSGLEVEEAGINRGNGPMPNEGTNHVPLILAGFDENDKPQWTNLLPDPFSEE